MTSWTLGRPVSYQVITPTALRRVHLSSLVRLGNSTFFQWARVCVRLTEACPRMPAPTIVAAAAVGQPVITFRRHLSTDTKKPKVVSITFIDRDGDEHTVEGKVGDTLLEVAKEYDIDLEGACEGTLSCSTCHLIVSPEWYDKIPDPLTEEEQDMLDLAFGLCDTSRLGCQILVSEALDGLKLRVPSATTDARNT